MTEWARKLRGVFSPERPKRLSRGWIDPGSGAGIPVALLLGAIVLLAGYIGWQRAFDLSYSLPVLQDLHRPDDDYRAHRLNERIPVAKLPRVRGVVREAPRPIRTGDRPGEAPTAQQPLFVSGADVGGSLRTPWGARGSDSACASRHLSRSSERHPDTFSGSTCLLPSSSISFATRCASATTAAGPRRRTSTGHAPPALLARLRAAV